MTTSVKNLDELDRTQDFCDLFQVLTLSDCKKENIDLRVILEG